MGDSLIEIKNDFENQIKIVAQEILNLESELNKKKEHFLKLQGGLETLSLLEQKST
jgi:hypothetical protein